ncbi:MAG: phage holin family protein [Candidatus Latescibacteria bacterium]|jgi:putative membrane protein|nr:phage holin family protein [Candidatus Latescibacterota bacterium]
MPRFLIRWLVTGLAIVLASYLLPGVVFESTFALVMGALVLGLLNSIVRPVLIILTLPITVMTLGLFLLVVNAITLWLATVLVPGFEVRGTSYIWAALLITIISWLLNMFIRKEERE